MKIKILLMLFGVYIPFLIWLLIESYTAPHIDEQTGAIINKGKSIKDIFKAKKQKMNKLLKNIKSATNVSVVLFVILLSIWGALVLLMAIIKSIQAFFIAIYQMPSWVWQMGAIFFCIIIGSILPQLFYTKKQPKNEKSD